MRAQKDFDLSQGDLLLFVRTPVPAQVRLVSVLAGLLFVAFLASLPFGPRPLAKIPSFIPVVDTGLLLGDVLTATLLFGQAAVLRSRALMMLATGYLFTGLIIIPHALTFPDAFSSTGLLGAGVSTTIWLYFFWHGGLPLAVIGYGVLKRRDDAPSIAPAVVRRMILGCVFGTVGLVVVLTVLATAGHRFLPVLMTDSVTWLSGPVFYIALVVLALLVGAMVAVSRRPVSLLDLWLLLALWAWMLELLLVLDTSTRYSAGWYVGRIAGLLSGVFVLLMLLSETNRLYIRLATTVTQQRRERASRLLTMNAVAASIAHEVKQPLASMIANARTGLARLRQAPSRTESLPELLDAIARDGDHAVDVVDSVRAMFRAQHRERISVNMNELIQETAALVANELAGHRVSLTLQTSDQAPLVLADRVQIQHVLLNLFTNAIEAMSGVAERPRVLVVRSGTTDDGDLVVGVEDSGVGFDPATSDRIFETFFTTKAEGTGMGLPLCRSIIEGHGGELRASLRQPVGAVFEFTLPTA